MTQKTNYCDNCGKKDQEVYSCFCYQRDFHKYSSNGFPPEEFWKEGQMKKGCFL